MRHKKTAGELAVGDTLELPAGEALVGVHSVRSILRMRCGGMTINIQSEGKEISVPLPDVDLIQFVTGVGRTITLPASQVVEVL